MKQALIYAFLVSPTLPVIENLGSTFLQIFPFRDLFVVYTEVSREDFGEEALSNNLKDVSWLHEKAQWHIGIQQTLQIDQDIIPFPFATIFTSLASLSQRIEEQYEQLKESFTFIEGTEEWGIKLYVSPKQLEQGVNAKAELQILQQELLSASKGKAFLLQKKLRAMQQQLIKQEISDMQVYAIEQCAEQSKDKQILKLPEQKPSPDQETELILNAALLFAKKDLPLFQTRVSQLVPQFMEKGFQLKVNGPWPPYHFV